MILKGNVRVQKKKGGEEGKEGCVACMWHYNKRAEWKGGNVGMRGYNMTPDKIR